MAGSGKQPHARHDSRLRLQPFASWGAPTGGRALAVGLMPSQPSGAAVDATIPATREVDDAPRTSGLVPLLVALAAPVSVVAALALTGNALVAFAAYHVGVCLLVPVLALHLSEHSMAEVGHHLALRAPSREGWIAGLATGIATGASILGASLVFRPALVDADLVGGLAGWGIAGSPGLLLVYMLAFNSGAEELLWRGYLHTEAVGRLGSATGVGVLALLFASYHLYTLWSLLPSVPLALIGGLAVLAGALLWAGLRERYASLVPALLGHVGATAGYMTVYLQLA